VPVARRLGRARACGWRTRSPRRSRWAVQIRVGHDDGVGQPGSEFREHRPLDQRSLPASCPDADEIADLEDTVDNNGVSKPVEQGKRAFGHSKDLRTDLPQVVIAMAVTSDGASVRCWTFPGKTNDTAIVRTVKDDLDGWNLRRIVWVVDRRFASAANICLTCGGGHYIHAEKQRHTNTAAGTALARPGRYRTVAGNLRVEEVHVAPGGRGDGGDGVRAERFVVCHNPERGERDATVRANLVANPTALIAGSDTWSPRCRDEFVGSLKTKPGLCRYLRRTSAGLLRVDAGAIKAEAHLDGKWLLRSSDTTLTPDDLPAACKQLLQVRGWRDMKGALDLRPVFHHHEDRIRAHVQLCWLALLLIRVIENDTDETWRNIRHELDRMHLVTLATPDGRVPQPSTTTGGQNTVFTALNLAEPLGSSTSPPAPTDERSANGRTL
jgi:hypothetical protein